MAVEGRSSTGDDTVAAASGGDLPMTSGASSAPLVSAILPTYGRSELLHDAVASVDEQTYDNIELIVVDDHSPEPVGPQLDGRAFDLSRLRCLRHEENRGANTARNTGLEAADGEYVAFLDDDDYWLPTKIQRQVETFEAAGERVGVVYTGQKFVVDGTTASVHRPTVRGNVLEEMLTGEEIGTFSTVMARSEVPDVVGGLDERFPCWQDREWLLRVSTEYEFEYVPEPLTVRRSSGHDQISDDFEAKRDVAYPLFLEKFRPLAAEYGPEYERALVAAQARELGKSGVRHGYFGDGRKYLLEAIKHDPTDVGTYLYLLTSLGGNATLRPAQFLRRTLTNYLT